MFDNITAISSGNINQPISIIRVSGPDAFNIVNKIFTGKIGSDKTITYGNIIDGTKTIDEVLVSWFKGPNTFTGEDIVEINAHGGVINSQNILKLILSNGARIAENGEFSRRAFMNGKMDLIKAEAIHDLIFAKTEEQTNLSVKKFDGKTSKLIEDITKQLLEVISTIETNIDYPEYDDIEKLNNENIKPKLVKLQKELKEILESSKSSRHIFEGIKVAIVGKPNAGKSSLLNVLINENKAIVTDVPGTTRDIVEGTVQIGQLLLNFKDTAGIRHSKDKVEKIGIEKSLEQITNSDLVIHVVDSNIGADEEDSLIEEKSKGKIYIKVFNKSDLKKVEGISISAKDKNIDNLINEIKNNFKNIDLNNEKIITNTRQLALIDIAIKNINDSIKGIEKGFEPDEIILDIRSAYKNIGNIIGESSDEELLDSMFKNFCLGK